jgi:ribosomal protein S6--L-glutamate ligase
VLDPLAATPEVGASAAKPLDFEAAIPRVVDVALPHSLACLRWLAARGVVVLEDADAIARAGDKLATLTALEAAGVPVPRSALPRSGAALRDFVGRAGGPPVILKLLRGHGGTGVMRVDGVDQAEAMLAALLDLGQCVLAQEALPAEDGDLRLIVVAGEVLGAVRRRPAAGEFRANVHAGGACEAVRAPREVAELALRATRAVGLRAAGVDVMFSSRGPLVMEVNASFGLKGFEEATLADVAGRLVEAIAREAGVPRRT